jgi:hypothetical protein
VAAKTTKPKARKPAAKAKPKKPAAKGKPPEDFAKEPIEIWRPPPFSEGRPKAEIDLGVVEELAAIGCTIEEIAAVCRVCVRTLYRRKADDSEFAEALERGKLGGKASLRRMLFVSANRGNIAAQIFLSKQKDWLGYADKLEQSGPDGGPVQHKVILTFVRPGEAPPAPAPETTAGPNG